MTLSKAKREKIRLRKEERAATDLNLHIVTLLTNYPEGLTGRQIQELLNDQFPATRDTYASKIKRLVIAEKIGMQRAEKTCWPALYFSLDFIPPIKHHTAVTIENQELVSLLTHGWRTA